MSEDVWGPGVLSHEHEGPTRTQAGAGGTAIGGHSWGGSWSLYFAERHPERVDRLVLLDSTGLDVALSKDWRPLTYPVIGELLGKLMSKSDAAHYLRKAFAHPVPKQTIAGFLP